MNVTTGSPTIVPDPAGGPTIEVIVLAVFVAVLGLSTLGLALYIIITRCIRDRQKRNIEEHVEENGKEQYTMNEGDLTTVLTEVPPDDQPDDQEPAPPSGAAGGPHVHWEDAVPSHGQPGDSSVESEDTIAEAEDKITPLLPKFSMKYRRKTLDVFCDVDDVIENEIVPERASRIGILMAAQGCYQNMSSGLPSPNRGTMRSIYTDGQTADRSIESLLEQDMIPVIEEVQAVNVATLHKMPPSISPTPVTPLDSRPKSFANVIDKGASASSKPSADVSHGMFVSKRLGKVGGVVELFGVKLEIPPGALDEDKDVSLGVLWSADHQPKLEKHQAILTPIVSCEPHGLVLKKDAFLTIPHCAHNVYEDWKIDVMCSETSTSVLPAWKKNSTNFELVGKSKVKVTLKHFTLYTAPGEAKSEKVIPTKWVDLIAFAPPLNQGSLFNVSVFCVNDYDEEEAKDMKKMKRRTEANKSKEQDQKRILFHGDENDLELEVSISKECNDWKMSDVCSNKQKLDYDLVWQAAGPSSKFVLTSGDKKCNKIVCSVDGFQIGHTDKKKTLVVAEEEQIIAQTTNSKIDLQLLECVFPPKLRETIIKLLDPNYDAASNWEQLAEKMGKKMHDIYWLKDVYRQTGKSPTIYLLQDWVKCGKNLEEFNELVLEIGRRDLHEDIQNWIQSTTS